MGKIWWESTHATYLRSRQLEQINWEEFQDVFYSQYFSATIKSKKKTKFLLLKLHEVMSVVEDQTQFLSLEKFAPGNFDTEIERATQFVSGLYINFRSVVPSFTCSTLAGVVMRALE